MKLHSLALASVIAVSSFAVACGGTVETPQTQASAATKAPVAQNTHGAVKLVGDALGEVALRPEQRAEIEKLAADAEARHQPMAEGKKELLVAFADQVESGAIDRGALQPKIDKVTSDGAKARTEDRAALVKLHDILDKQQRNDFADALERQVKGKRGELHVRGGGERGFGPLHKLASDLNLTDEQKTKIKDALKESFKEGMKEAREHHRGGPRRGPHGGGKHGGGKHGPRGNPIEAFREDKLELPGAPPGPPPGAFGDHMLKTAEKILPILTPEQRKLAADKLRTLATEGNAALIVH
ncbi:MAG: Spy/CpxP family protein refolding chaperone [Labilithrix sp.]|nr:Spy/CpxP family protein refolding chaperone [Labilithrix sp.]MCW5810119.1 Spy/CpxP family protein refolding chaperone [Labilithrix sp.]